MLPSAGHKLGNSQSCRLHVFVLIVQLTPSDRVLDPGSLFGQSREQAGTAGAASFDTLYESGIRFLRAGQTEKAIEYLTQAADQNNESKAARCSLGQALSTAGRSVEAIEQFQRWWNSIPTTSKVTTSWGRPICGSP